MDDALIGKAVMQVTADTTQFSASMAQAETVAQSMERAVTASAGKAAGAVTGMGKAASGGVNDLDSASRRYQASLEREIAALTLSRAEYRKWEAQTKGISESVYAPLVKRLEEAQRAQIALRTATGSTAQGLNLVGASAGQARAALQQLPAQITDIVTGLASGQNALLVLIQQGGQIKDSFGGVGNALKALGAAISPTALLFGSLALAGGALALAYKSGADESLAYARALIMTGNAAGTSVGQLQQMAKAVAAITGGTQGKAAEALTELAGSARVAGGDLAKLTTAAVALERAGGPAATETAKAFVELGRAPTQAAQKLTEASGFLTKALFEQIRGLEATGQRAEAAAVAQRAYADNAQQAAQRVEERLGILERGWRVLKDAASGAWDAMKGLGRAETVESQLDAVSAELNRRRRVVGPELSSRSNDLMGQQSVLQSDILTARRGTEVQAAARAVGEAGVEFSKLAETMRLPDKSLAELLSKIKNLGSTANLSQGEIDALLKRASSLSAVNSQAIATEQARIAGAARVEAERTAGAIEDLQHRGQMGMLAEWELLQQIGEANEKVARSELARLQQQRALIGRMPAEQQAQALVANTAEIEAAQVRIANAHKKTADDVEAALHKRALAAQQAIAAERELWRSEQDAADRDTDQRIASFARAEQDYADSLKDAAFAQGRLAAAASLNDRERAVSIAQLQVELDLRKRIRQIESSGLSQAEQDAAIARATENAKIASAQVIAQVTQDFQTNAARSIQQSLLDAMVNGFDNAWAYLRNLFKREALTVVFEPVIKLGAAALAGSLPSVAGATGGTSVLQLGGAYSGISGAYNALSSGFAGVGTAASNLYGSLSTSGIGQRLGMSSLVEDAAGNVYFAPAAGATATGSVIGSVASYAAGAGTGVLAGRAISGGYSAIGSSGNTAVNVGTLLGSYFGPLGALAGGAIGGIINRAFGLSSPSVQGRNLTGSFSGSGDFSGSIVTDIMQKGGWFRSDRWSQVTDAIVGDLDKALDEGGKKMVDLAERYGKALGLPVEQLANVTQTVAVKLTEDAQANSQAAADALTAFGDSLFAQYKDAIEPLRLAGEDIATTIERVGSALQQTNGVLDALGLKLLDTSVAGGQAALALDGLFGGASGLQQIAGGYLKEYYTEAEQAALTTKAVTAALADVNLALPDSRDAFRQLVDAQDLTTDAGRRAFAALIGVSEAFSSITESAVVITRSSADIASERDRLETQYLTLIGDTEALRARERAQIDASNQALYDRINALQDEQAATKAAQVAADALNKLLNSTSAPMTASRAQASANAQADIAAFRDATSSEWVNTLVQQTKDAQNSYFTGLNQQFVNLGLPTGVDPAQYQPPPFVSEDALRSYLAGQYLQQTARLGDSSNAERWMQEGTQAAQELAQKQDELRKSIESLDDSLRSFRDSLATGNLSALSPEAKYQYAAAQFGSVSRQAMGGDQAAAEQLQSVSQAFLEASRAYQGSGMGYAVDFGAVVDALNKSIELLQSINGATEAGNINSLRGLVAIADGQRETTSAVRSQGSAALLLAQRGVE